MRRYELMLLIRPDLEDDKLQAAVERVTRTIVNAGGSLAKVSPWGKRRLAYRLQNFREASYFLLHFDIQPRELREIERTLLISEEILRHLVTLIGEREPEGQQDHEALPAADEAGEEEQAAEEPQAAGEPQAAEEPPVQATQQEPAESGEAATEEAATEEEPAAAG